jgi:dihydropteroate synthase
VNNQEIKNWCYRQIVLPNSKTLPIIMGIINVTPDSFSDGGCYYHLEDAWLYAKQLIDSGADILDIGGESSRPGAQPISITDEIARVVPLIKRIRQNSDICISIDTNKALVMQAAVDAGAGFINDISALCQEDALITASQLQVPICLMHMQGTPKTMQYSPSYSNNIITEINDFFQDRINCCLEQGIKREYLILDPGFGFGKTMAHNLQIIRDIRQFHHHQLPIMLGVSRKSTLGSIIDKPVGERLIPGITINIMACLQGVAIIRTHDVCETKQALLTMNAVNNLII